MVQFALILPALSLTRRPCYLDSLPCLSILFTRFLLLFHPVCQKPYKSFYTLSCYSRDREKFIPVQTAKIIKLIELIPVRCINFCCCYRHIFLFQFFAVEFKLRINLLKVLNRIAWYHSRNIHHVKKDGCPLNMAKKFESEPRTLMRVFDQTGDICNHKAPATFGLHNSKHRR